MTDRSACSGKAVSEESCLHYPVRGAGTGKYSIVEGVIQFCIVLKVTCSKFKVTSHEGQVRMLFKVYSLLY